MYSKELITAYMKQKNYSQQKQVAAELGLSTSYINQVWNGRLELTDITGILIAKECGFDPAEVVAKLAEARAKTVQEKTVWADVVKKYKASALPSAGAALLLVMALPMANLLTSHSHSYVKKPA